MSQVLNHEQKFFHGRRRKGVAGRENSICKKHRGIEKQREELDVQWAWSIECVARNGARGG